MIQTKEKTKEANSSNWYEQTDKINEDKPLVLNFQILLIWKGPPMQVFSSVGSMYEGNLGGEQPKA